MKFHSEGVSDDIWESLPSPHYYHPKSIKYYLIYFLLCIFNLNMNIK